MEASYAELDHTYKAGKLNAVQKNVFRSKCPPEELFHVGKDPHQLNNLASNPEYAPILEMMRLQLGKWTEQTGDSIPQNPRPDRGALGTEGKSNPHREFPGKSTGAETINNKGPIRIK